MTDGEPELAGIDPSRPNVARIYDYLLGGKDNFAADRETAEKIIAAAPEAPAVAIQNRQFLGRAIQCLAEVGIRQFVDIGSGLPTASNVHEVAQRIAPDSRVVYVDYDPVVLTHSRALLATNDATVVIDADARRPDDIFNHPDFEKVVDLSRPVAVLFVSVLHCLTDDEDPFGVVTRFRERMASGSHLVISHITAEDRVDAAKNGASIYTQAGASTQMTLRDRNRILTFFDGFELVEPGLVPLQEWRPDIPSRATGSSSERRHDALPIWYLCGIGRKP